MDFKDLMRKRRSCRQFTNQEIAPDDVERILQAALISPSSMNRRSWHFIVVDEKDDLEKLSDAKQHGATLIKGAALAVVVAVNETTNDCWIEDGSIAAISMQFAAEDLGIGSCWVEMRNRRLSDGTEAEDVVRGILGIPEEMRVLCVVAFGYRDGDAQPHSEDDLKWEQVHIGKFRYQAE